jgi:membrane protein YdbS with pleckstrin-like domain
LRDLQSFDVDFAEFMTLDRLERGENKMSDSYAAVSVLIFAIVAIMHLVRIINGWSVAIGPHNIPRSVSWAGLVVAALLAVWGVVQIG